MATTNNPNIICIEDEKEEANLKPTTTQSKPQHDLPCQPTNFNPKTFPFLASMLKKITNTTPKPEIEVSQPKHSINIDTPAQVEVIKPLKIDGI